MHVPFCSVRCGYCDFNTYTADELGEGATRASYADTAILEIERSRAGSRAACRGRDGVLRWRHADAAAVGRPRPHPRRDRVDVRARRRCRGHDRGQPGQRHARIARELREGGFTRISYGVQSAVPHVLATLDRTHDPARRAAGGALGAGGRVRAGQPRPDLRHAGGVDGRLAASLDQALALEPDHVSAYALIVEDGHGAGTAGRARRGRGARRRRDRRQVRAGRRRARGRRTRLVRAVELGARRGGAVPAQPPLLARRRLVGHRARRALARRRGALVERQAPGGVRGAAAGGGVPRQDREVLDAAPRGRAGDARDPAREGCRSTSSRTDAAPCRRDRAGLVEVDGEGSC